MLEKDATGQKAWRIIAAITNEVKHNAVSLKLAPNSTASIQKKRSNTP